MQLERRRSRKSPWLITFDKPNEVAAVRSATSEVIHRKAQEGEARSSLALGRLVASGNFATGEVEIDEPEDDETMLKDDEIEPEVMKLRLKELSDITDVLDAFGESTDEAIIEIPLLTETPPFLTDEIPERLRLHIVAQALSAEIKKKAASLEEKTKALEAATGFDADSAFSELLGGQPPT